MTERALGGVAQPVIIGNRVGGFGSYRDGHELFLRAASHDKDLLVIDGASHYDLYDPPESVDQAVDRLPAFNGAHLT